jgi:hypothetical protein
MRRLLVQNTLRILLFMRQPEEHVISMANPTSQRLKFYRKQLLGRSGGAPAHDLVDEMCLAGTAQPENDGGDAAQSMTSINHRQHKRKLCSSQKHFVKAKSATKRPSADSVLEDARKYDADVHLLQQQLRGVPAAHSLLHPLDFLDLSDVAALGISCKGNLASELYYDYFQRWASKHGCEDLWDESWNEVMAALV